MRRTARPRLAPGRIYRTADLRRWTSKPSELAQRLVHEGKLERLATGIFRCPRRNPLFTA